MPQRSRTAPSTPRLSEYARKFAYPQGRIERTVWTRVEAKGRELGLGFDWWQSQLGTVCLGYGADGRYVATVGGIGLSIPRQVGKTYFVMALLLVLCILFPGTQVVWTSHHLRTTNKTLTTIKGLTRRRKIAPHIRTVRTSHGEGQVEFVNGSTIMFGARAQGFGRGFDEIDVEVFDEAQILDTKALEDMIAATNQARHPHGALLFFMGTPPRAQDPSEAFRMRREEAHAAELDDAIWLEISADPDSDVNDEAEWPRMNPSYPNRTPRESLLRLRKNLKDDDSWNREGRGVWDKVGAASVIRSRQWDALALPAAAAPVAGTVAFAVKFSLDGLRVGCGVALVPLEGPAHVEAFGVRPIAETSSVVEWLAERWRNADSILVDGKAGAGDFCNELVAAGVPRRRIHIVTADEAITAHSAFLRAVLTGGLTHLAQPGLDAQVRIAGKRKIGAAGGWGWQPTIAGGDVTALDAVTLALHGATTSKKGRGRTSGGDRNPSRRTAVIL
jgi:hypothetical protein